MLVSNDLPSGLVVMYNVSLEHPQRTVNLILFVTIMHPDQQRDLLKGVGQLLYVVYVELTKEPVVCGHVWCQFLFGTITSWKRTAAICLMKGHTPTKAAQC